MTTRHGLCTNFGLCGKADGREPIAATQAFVCPECDKPLAAARQGSNQGRRTALLAAGAAVVVAGSLYALIPAAPPAGNQDSSLQAQLETGADDTASPTRPVEQKRNPPARTNGFDAPRRHVRTAGQFGRNGSAPASGTPMATAVTPIAPVAPAPAPRAAATPVVATPPPQVATSMLEQIDKTQLEAELVSRVVISDDDASLFEARVRKGSYAGATIRGTATRTGDGHVELDFRSIDFRGESRPITADLMALVEPRGGNENDRQERPSRAGTLAKKAAVSGGIGALLRAFQGEGLKDSAKGAAETAVATTLTDLVTERPSATTILPAGTTVSLIVTDASARSNR